MDRSALPQPLVPPEADLSDFGFMPLECARFRDSGLASEVDPAAAFYAVVLWTVAWHQSPAGSLPAGEQALAKLAGFGRDLTSWQQVRDGALRGFVACDDGRLYHPVVCEKALEAWIERLHGRLRGGIGNAKRWKIAFDPGELKRMLERAQKAQKRLHHFEDRPAPPPPPVEPPPPAPAAKPAVAKKAARPRPGEERYSDKFEEFWQAYPAARRNKKLEAWQRWQRDQLEEFADTIIRDVVTRQREHWGWVKEAGKYIPGAQVYLNGRRWNDAMEAPRPDGRRAGTEQGNASTAQSWAERQAEDIDA